MRRRVRFGSSVAMVLPAHCVGDSIPVSGRVASTMRDGALVCLEKMKSPITSTAASMPASYR